MCGRHDYATVVVSTPPRVCGKQTEIVVQILKYIKREERERENERGYRCAVSNKHKTLMSRVNIIQ